MCLVVAAATASCDRDAAAKPVITGDARLDFQTMPDGPAPGVFGPGPSLSTFNPPDDVPALLKVTGGKLTNDPLSSGVVAGYFTSADLGAPVTTLGARWTFTPRGGTPGTMALVISKTAVHQPFSVHLVVTPNLWTFGVWPEGAGAALDTLVMQRFDVPLKQDGATIHEVRLQIEGERVTLWLPDGRERVIRDPRIAEWAGSFATFEAYYDHGLTDSRVGFTQIWAQSQRVGSD